MTDRTKKILRWFAGAIGVLLLIIVLALTFMDWNLFKHPIERMASAASGRTVRIDGPLQVHIWSLTPTITLTGLTLGNPPWEASRPMASIERVEIHIKLLPLLKGDVILPRLALVKPDIYLHQDKSGRANWTFESKAPTNEQASKPSKVPALRDLLIQDGKLTLIDEMRHLKVDGTLQASDQKTQADATPFKIKATGTINDQRFEMQVAGGPLINLDPEHAYPFDLAIKAGDLEVASKGKALKPFDLGKLDFDVTLSGKDLAEGFYLTQLALPNTAPFKLHAHIARDGMKIDVTDIAGTVGGSDLRGRLDIDATRKRPVMKGELMSKQLRMQDLAASLGAQPKGGDSLDAKAEARQGKSPKSAGPAPQKEPPRLFPDARLQVARVRAMDADVKFSANSIEAGSVPFTQVAFRVKLQEGVLTLDPLAVEMPQGRVTGEVRIDARKDVPLVHIALRIKDIQLNQLKSKKPGATAALEGVMQARVEIDGRGDSLHALMSDANGKLTAVLPQGQVTSAFPELTGIDISKGLGLLISKPDEKVDIRCGVAQFDLKDGLMTASNITFDTQAVLIKGQGDIKLGPEELDLDIKGEPKKVRLTRLRSPVEIRGHLASPRVALNAGSVAKQGAVAVALGTLLTPAAAILAFVDPGLAKDENCVALMAETAQKDPAVPKVKEAAHHTKGSEQP